MSRIPRSALIPIGIAIALSLSAPALAQSAGSTTILDNVTNRFTSAMSGWSGTFQKDAAFLFYSLALISAVWTFGQKAVQQADLGDILGELIRFVVFTGIFGFFLSNGVSIATAIINSTTQMGNEAAGFSSVSSADFLAVGFKILSNTVSALSLTDIPQSLASILVCIALLIVLALCVINFILIQITVYFLAYAGVFLLGFGGSRWTSDIAINYFKTVFGVSLSLMAVVLILGIGNQMLTQFSASSTNTIEDDVALLIIALLIYALSEKLPPMLANMLSGHAVGSAGSISGMAGRAMRDTAIAGAAVATGGAAALASGAANAAGAAQALSAATQAGAGGGESSGNLAPPAGGGGSDSSGAGEASGGLGPLASAMGDGVASAASGGSSSAMGGNAANGGQAEAGQGGSESGASADGGGAAAGAGAGGGAGSAARNLFAGAGRMAGNAIGGIGQKWQDKVAATAGGRLASEISNPGQAAQERQDATDAAKGADLMNRAKTAVAGEQARAMFADGPATAMENAKNAIRAGAQGGQADTLAPATGPKFSGDTISGGAE